MKKISVILLSIILVISLAGCGFRVKKADSALCGKWKANVNLSDKMYEGLKESLSTNINFNDFKILHASSALPVICNSCEIDGERYYDGGISDPIPVEKAFKEGCEKAVVILTKPIEYRNNKEKHDIKKIIKIGKTGIGFKFSIIQRNSFLTESGYQS